MHIPKPLLRASLSLFLFQLCGASTLFAQQDKILFERSGVKEGLPEEWVASILQDQQGFMWFTTQNGLVKYDGYTFKTYRANSPDQKEGNIQFSNLSGKVIEGKDGKLWMAGIMSNGGLASFDPRTERFEN